MSILIKVVSKNELPMGSYTQITVRELAGPTEQVTSELPLER